MGPFGSMFTGSRYPILPVPDSVTALLAIFIDFAGITITDIIAVGAHFTHSPFSVLEGPGLRDC